jgi:autotransporter passenger strand-loop-strand repeat protein
MTSYTLNPSIDNDMLDSASYTPIGLPGPNDTVTTFSGGVTAVLSGSLNIGTLNNLNNGTIDVIAGGALTLGSYNDSGTTFVGGGGNLTINSDYTVVDTFIHDGGSVISVNGTITVGEPSNTLHGDQVLQVASGAAETWKDVTLVTGQLLADTGGSVHITSALTFEGGTLNVFNGGSATIDPNVSISNGVVLVGRVASGSTASSTATFNGDLTVSGNQANVGVSNRGTLTVQGNLEADSAGAVGANLGGTMVVDGHMTLSGGSISIAPVSANTPSVLMVSAYVKMASGTLGVYDGGYAAIGGGTTGQVLDQLQIGSAGYVSGFGTISSTVTGQIAVGNSAHTPTYSLVVDNRGKVEANGGILTIDANVGSNSTGQFLIDDNSTLEIGGSFAKGSTITFQSDGTGTLILDDPADFHGSIDGIALGDKIELRNTNLNNGNAVLEATIGDDPSNSLQTLEIGEDTHWSSDIFVDGRFFFYPIQGATGDGTITSDPVKGAFFDVTKTGISNSDTLLTLTKGNPIDLAVNGPTARQSFGVDGSGIKVGIISAGGEGSACAAVVKEIAPGVVTQIVEDPSGFYDGNTFAQAIQLLREGGCQIIMDDISVIPAGPGTASLATANSAIEAAVKAGVTYITAAGNDGNDVPISDQALNGFAITVGAINLLGTPNPPSTVGGYLPAISEVYSQAFGLLNKPDISAPVGGPTPGPLITNTLIQGHNPFFGTSAAAPVVAAIAALMMHRDTQLDPSRDGHHSVALSQAIEGMLEGSAVPFGDSAISGHGLVQADQAVALADEGEIVFYSGSGTGSTSSAMTSLAFASQTGPIVTSAALSQPDGDVRTGSTVQFLLSLNEAVTITGGTPALMLNDGGIATYDSATSTPSTGSLVFDYTIGTIDQTADLSVTAVSLNGATVQDVNRNGADLSGLFNVPTNLSINSPLAGLSISASQTGEVALGQSVQLTLSMNKAVTVDAAGGAPTLTLNNGATATYDAASSSPLVGKLVFDYTVGASDSTPNVSICGVDLPHGTTVQDANGNNADFSNASLYQNIGLQVGPAFVGEFFTSQTGAGHTGQVVQLVLGISEAVALDTTAGSPTLTLNDGATATYDVALSDTATGTLVFDYAVGNQDHTPSLAITQVNLNGASVRDAHGVNVDFSAALNSPAEFSINSPLGVTQFSASQSGQVVSGQTIQLTLKMSEGVLLHTIDNFGAPPQLLLNDGANATYDATASNPSSGTLVFDYTIGPGDETTNLAVSGVMLHGPFFMDSQGNLPDFSGAFNLGTNLQIVTPNIVSAGETLTVSSGENGNQLTVLSGGTLNILAGGTAASTTISSGGFVQDLGTAGSATIGAGGGLVIFAGGTDSGTTISNGGNETVLSGGLAWSTTALSIGVLNVLAGGAAIGTMDNGGADVVSGNTVGTLVGSSGIEAVFGPGTSLSATVLAGGIQYVLSGGRASGTTDSGGADIVLAAGIASGTEVAGGGTEVASSGGTLTSTTVLAGGIQYVLSGGTASSTTDADGVDIVLAGGVERGATVSSGGIEVASSGATLLSSTVLSGGIQYILSGGTGIGTTDSGGVDIVLAGGLENGTKVSSGGIEVASSGGELLSASVLPGGVEYALSGGLASGTIVNGGNEQILSGGTAAGATVEGGGFLVVSSGGTVNGATISGATLEIQGGGLTGSNPIIYSGGAALILDASANFIGTIAGFTAGDYLDLRDIAFGSSTSMSFAGNNLSGTLTVTDGSHTAHITLLGDYSPGQFNSGSDGHNGTVITDPPASAPVLWTSTPNTDALLWQPTTSEASTGPSPTAELRGGDAGMPTGSWQGPTAGTWLHGDPANLLWQPANSDGGVMAAGFLQTASAGTLGWTMHQPSLGG